MENKDFNKRILNRLEEKIAIEEFRKENNIQKKKKSNVFFKVASFIAIIGVVGTNIYTYAAFKQDVITYVLDKLGIFNDSNKESLVQVNETKESNDITLTLENYAIENNILIIGYKLKANADTDLGVKYVIDDTDYISDNQIYHLEKSTSSALSKISDTEYELFKIYNLGNMNISDGDILNTRLFLPKYLDIGEHVGEWEFNINLEPNKKASNSEKYIVNDVRGSLEWIGETYNMQHTFSVLEVEDTDLFTKLVILLESYWTGRQAYTIEVTDENGNVILEEGVQNLFGGVPTEIVLKKLDFNSKIIINVYEKSGEEVTAKGGTILDLSKDLEPKEEKPIEYTTMKWKDLEFKYDKEMEVYKTHSSTYWSSEGYEYINFGLYTIVGNKKDNTRDGSIHITCERNEFNHNVQELFEEYKNINKVSYTASLFKARYPIYLDGGIDLILNHEQIIELSKNGEVNVNGTVINSSNYEFSEIEYTEIKNIQIDGVNAITWKEYSDRLYMFVYNGNYYQIRTPNAINAIERVNEFIENIRFL